MRAQFVATENAKRFVASFTALQNRGAGEACLMVVDGVPGLSKTTTVQWWAVQHGAVFVRAKKEWTPAWMLRDILECLRKTPVRSFSGMFRQTVEVLTQRAMIADRDGQPFALIVDEVDHISRSERMLETLRDLSDMLEVPTILVGMGRVRQNLARFPQIMSRISQPVEFTPAPLEDCAALVQALCEVPVAPDLVALLHRVSQGCHREIKEGCAAIERLGKRKPGQTIGIAEMAGLPLLTDRITGQSIVVRP